MIRIGVMLKKHHADFFERCRLFPQPYSFCMLHFQYRRKLFAPLCFDPAYFSMPVHRIYQILLQRG